MRTYLLTDRDIAEFDSILEKVESHARAKYEAARYANTDMGNVMADYRYHLIGWRNQMIRGDTINSQICVDSPNEGWVRKEIARLTTLLPEGESV